MRKVRTDPEESEKLGAQLKNEGVSLLTADEKNAVINKVYKNETADSLAKNGTKETADRTLSDEMIHDRAKAIISELNWSEDKLEITKNGIRFYISKVFERTEKTQNTVYVISSALMYYGTYLRNKQSGIENIKNNERPSRPARCAPKIVSRMADRICRYYSDERAKRLVQYCVEDGRGDEVMESMLVCMIREIPPIIVRIS